MGVRCFRHFCPAVDHDTILLRLVRLLVNLLASLNLLETTPLSRHVNTHCLPIRSATNLTTSHADRLGNCPGTFGNVQSPFHLALVEIAGGRCGSLWIHLLSAPTGSRLTKQPVHERTGH